MGIQVVSIAKPDNLQTDQDHIAESSLSPFQNLRRPADHVSGAECHETSPCVVGWICLLMDIQVVMMGKGGGG